MSEIPDAYLAILLVAICWHFFPQRTAQFLVGLLIIALLYIGSGNVP